MFVCFSNPIIVMFIYFSKLIIGLFVEICVRVSNWWDHVTAEEWLRGFMWQLKSGGGGRVGAGVNGSSMSVCLYVCGGKGLGVNTPPLRFRGEDPSSQIYIRDVISSTTWWGRSKVKVSDWQGSLKWLPWELLTNHLYSSNHHRPWQLLSSPPLPQALFLLLLLPAATQN